MNIDKCLTVSATLSNNWYIQLHAVFLTYLDDFSVDTILEIKNSIHTNAEIIDIWDNCDFIYIFFNCIGMIKLNSLISRFPPFTDLIIEENKTILKELWQEHAFLKNTISEKIHENTNLRNSS